LYGQEGSEGPLTFLPFCYPSVSCDIWYCSSFL